jgi:hypothetical protein
MNRANNPFFWDAPYEGPLQAEPSSTQLLNRVASGTDCVGNSDGISQTHKDCLYGINERHNLYSGQIDLSGTDLPHGVDTDKASEWDQRGSYKYATIADPAYDHRNDSFFLDRQGSDYQDN